MFEKVFASDLGGTKKQSIMHVNDLITLPVTTCTTSMDIGGVRDLLHRKNFSALPVVDSKEDKIVLKGIVSYQDLAGVYDDNINVQQVMSTDVTTIAPTATVKEAALTMIKHRIHHLVVTDQDKIVGIISTFDFLKLVADSVEREDEFAV